MVIESSESRQQPSQHVFAELRYKTGRDLLQSRSVQEVVAYARDWDALIVNREPKVSRDQKGIIVDQKTQIIFLPYAFVTPSNAKTSPEAAWGDQQFYWDTYFNNKGLLLTGRADYKEIAKGQIENLQYLFENLGYIPNGASMPLANRSQLPLLSSMIFDIYAVEGNKEWLQEKIAFAKAEYQTVWMMTPKEAKQEGYRRQTHRVDDTSLATTYVGADIRNEHYPAAGESARDDTAAWARRAYSMQPVDLHCALYKYEKDFAKAAEIAGNLEEKAYWEQQAEARKDYVNEMFWDEKQGWYFNYDLARKKKDDAYWDVMGYMTMWVGMATQEQADRMVKHLGKFEAEYGLTMSSEDSLLTTEEIHQALEPVSGENERLRRFEPTFRDAMESQQWDRPYMWSPAMQFVEDGLDNYGYRQDAKRIREKSLRSFAAFFAEKGTLPEKRNAFTGMNGVGKHYTEQEGFGLTKEEVLSEYDSLETFEGETDLHVLQYSHESGLQTSPNLAL